MKSIGIDAIALGLPHSYLELADLAEARGVVPAKYVQGLLVNRMAVADLHEDAVALAANAARRMFISSGRSPSEVGLCVVGSETGVDHSKPISAYLQSLLELPTTCRVYETKHACYGGTAGLLTALDWIASGSARGRTALVVCTDIARYALKTAGEPTQGAGAVALLISENPRLLELEVGTTGSYSRDVQDFWRPLYRKEAVVDGHYSVGCYLDAITGAYQGWQALCKQTGQTEPLARTCYHVPYGKMAVKAHRHRQTLDGMTEAQADATFEREVAPSLRLPAEVGNVYTGSLYLALASLLHHEAAVLEGQRIGLFSYGSGCAAEFFAGRVARGAAGFAEKLGLAKPLEGRRKLTVPEYEAIRGRDDEADAMPVGEIQPPATGGVAYLGIKDHVRTYRR